MTSLTVKQNKPPFFSLYLVALVTAQIGTNLQSAGCSFRFYTDASVSEVVFLCGDETMQQVKQPSVLRQFSLQAQVSLPQELPLATTQSTGAVMVQNIMTQTVLKYPKY